MGLSPHSDNATWIYRPKVWPALISTICFATNFRVCTQILRLVRHAAMWVCVICHITQCLCIYLGSSTFGACAKWWYYYMVLLSDKTHFAEFEAGNLSRNTAMGSVPCELVTVTESRSVYCTLCDTARTGHTVSQKWSFDCDDYNTCNIVFCGDNCNITLREMTNWVW